MDPDIEIQIDIGIDVEFGCKGVRRISKLKEEGLQK